MIRPNPSMGQVVILRASKWRGSSACPSFPDCCPALESPPTTATPHRRLLSRQVSQPLPREDREETDHAALLRQAPNTWNLGVTYDRSRFSMRFGVSHNDASIFSYFYTVTDPAVVNDPVLGLKCPTGDVYLYAHTQYDIQGSYRLVKGLHLVASGLTLSNEVFGFFPDIPRYPIQREFCPPTASLVLR